MGHTVDNAALETLFREARSYTKWQPRSVPDDTLSTTLLDPTRRTLRSNNSYLY